MAFDRRDDFWDIDKLVPNAKKPHPRFRTERQTKGVEIEGDGVSGESKLTLSLRGGESEESTYVPLSNPLIRKVTVRRFKPQRQPPIWSTPGASRQSGPSPSCGTHQCPR